MIRAAIVGMGSWGRHLVTSVQGKSEKIAFVAGAARNVEKSRDFADKQQLGLFASYEALLADSAIDAVVLATPHQLHAEQIIAAAHAGKHVFTEKPFALTRESAQAAAQACTDRDVILSVGFNWRFQPALREIKAMLVDKRLGKLLHMEGNFCGPSAYRFGSDHWRQKRDEGPAGGMTGRGVHVLDAMIFLAGRVDTLTAQSHRMVQDFGIDDTTSMLFKFRSGATGYLSTIIATAETFRIQVFGSKGWAEVGGIEHLPTWPLRVCFLDPDDLYRYTRSELMTFPETSTERAELEHFADAVANGQPVALPGGEEVHGVAVLEAILQSVNEAQRVTVPR